MGLEYREHEKTSDSGTRSLYPEGFYGSIKRAATLGIPMVITKNGFDTVDRATQKRSFREGSRYLITTMQKNASSLVGNCSESVLL